MKTILPLLLLPALALGADDDADLAELISRHQTGARELSDHQDELAADVQQLVIEQTEPTVIELFRSVEDAMDEASERLYEHDTTGVTIAAETDVIEKIYQAAKERQKCSGEGSGQGSAMLDMMQRMMGIEPDPSKKPGPGKGQDGTGEKGGEGQTGDSDSANQASKGAGGASEERRVPKGSGVAGKSIPLEFRDALDAYNRSAEKLAQ